jgi:hypothetical protein
MMRKEWAMEAQDILIRLKEAGIKDQIIANTVGASRETICRIRNGKTQDGHTGKSILENLQLFYNEVNPSQVFQVPHHQAAYENHTPDYSDSDEAYSDDYSNDEEEYSGFRWNRKWFLLIGGIMFLVVVASTGKRHGITSEQQAVGNLPDILPSQPVQSPQASPRPIRCVNCKQHATRWIVYRWDNLVPRPVCDSCALDARTKGLLLRW